MAKPKYEYEMDYIPDKELFKAVMYARKLRGQGMDMYRAIRKAAYYYDQDMSDVAHYVGQVGGRKSKER